MQAAFLLWGTWRLFTSRQNDSDKTARNLQLKQGKFDEFISPTKGYLRETCKLQNINPIYLTLSSPSVSFRP